MHATPRSTRRAFLKGQAALDALTQFDVGGDANALPAPRDERYLVRLARRAMACTFEIYLNAGQYPQSTAAALSALDLVDRLEDQLSVYREASEVSELNRTAAFLPVSVEPRLFELLRWAADLSRETGGAYDVTSGRLSQLWGFKHRRGEIPPAEELAAALELIGSRHLEFDPTERNIRFARPGLEINLGSIGKGYALDRAAEALAAAGINDFLIHGGNSSVLARGTHAGAENGSGWQIGLRNPLRPDRRLGHIQLQDRALGTSGSGTQFFMHEGRRYGHILDPRTGWPAEGVLTASALAPTAAAADALATAFYVLGPEAAQAFCQQHPEVGLVMVLPGGRTGAWDVVTAGLCDGEWSAYSSD